MTGGTRWLIGAVVCSTLALRCATSEDDPSRKKPGGYDDAGSGGTSGAGGSSGSGGSGGSSGSNDAGDASSDAPADAPGDAADAGNDAIAEAGDAAGDGSDSGTGGRVLLVARSASQIAFGESSGGAWSTTTVSRATLSTPAIVAAPWGALAVVRDQSGNALSHSSWDPATGTWSAFAPVAAGGATLGTPALVAPGSAHLAFLGTDNKLYSNVFTPGSGFGAFANVQAGTVHSFGPSAPALAVTGSGVMLAQEGSDGDLYTQVWQSGWQSAVPHALTVDLKPGTPPAATARAGTNNAVVAWIESGTQRVMWTEGSGSSWSNPVAVHPSAYSPSTPALATLPNGNLVVAWRALDDKVYATTVTGSTAATPALVHPSLGTTTSPAIAPGVGGHVAELVWVSGNAVQHSALGPGGWSGPVAVVANGELAVALATYAP